MEYHLMRDLWVIADSIVSSLGSSSEENYRAVRMGKSGITPFDSWKKDAPTVYASHIDSIQSSGKFTRFESMCAEALSKALHNLSLPKEKTLFILSTTKGNIALLDHDKKPDERIHLHHSAQHLAGAFGFQRYQVVSNACISGVMALIIAKRYIDAGKFDHAVVVGADELSEFIISGFQSLSALSNERCKPFDITRKGVNLGECAAVMVVSAAPEKVGADPDIKITGGGLSNDANHISGPSRTGDELAMAIRQALKESDTSISEIDFISAHGTATVFNDEMEAKAFHGIGFGTTPLNSLKGSFGHTLGAAGVLETVMSLHSLRNNEILPTVGFESHGVSQPVNINSVLRSRSIQVCVKTASGFGGCNAAIVLKKK